MPEEAGAQIRAKATRPQGCAARDFVPRAAFMKLVALETGWADVPNGLRKLAERIDAGDFPDLRFAVVVVVDTNDGFTTFGYGKMSVLEAIGALARAQRGDLVDG